MENLKLSLEKLGVFISPFSLVDVISLYNLNMQLYIITYLYSVLHLQIYHITYTFYPTHIEYTSYSTHVYHIWYINNKLRIS